MNVLNPRLIVLGGRLGRIHPYVIAALEAELDRRALAAPRSMVRVVPDVGWATTRRSSAPRSSRSSRSSPTPRSRVRPSAAPLAARERLSDGRRARWAAISCSRSDRLVKRRRDAENRTEEGGSLARDDS